MEEGTIPSEAVRSCVVSASIVESSLDFVGGKAIVGDCWMDIASSSLSSSLSSSSLLLLDSVFFLSPSRGFHVPLTNPTPAPHFLTSPPTPLFVTAKKYSFGYPCASMRWRRRVRGVENVRGQMFGGKKHWNYAMQKESTRVKGQRRGVGGKGRTIFSPRDCRIEARES